MLLRRKKKTLLRRFVQEPFVLEQSHAWQIVPHLLIMPPVIVEGIALPISLALRGLLCAPQHRQHG